MTCSECGFTLWSKESEEKGAHIECLEEDPIDILDLEEKLEKALNDDSIT